VAQKILGFASAAEPGAKSLRLLLGSLIGTSSPAAAAGPRSCKRPAGDRLRSSEAAHPGWFATITCSSFRGHETEPGQGQVSGDIADPQHLPD